jgi:hypothetical protein
VSALEEVNTNDRVEVRIRATKNMGDFNSLSVEVGLSRNVRADETPSTAYDKIRRGLEKELDRTFEQLTGEADGN